jgi:glutathione S-transferase
VRPQLVVFAYVPAHTHARARTHTHAAANSQGPIAVVKHLKLDVEIVNAYGKTRSPEFLAINPCHCCPTLEFDGSDGAMWESNAIMRYLCVNNEGGEELYPTDPILRGKIDMVMDWRQTAMYKPIPSIAYIVFGMKMEDEAAKKDFADLMTEHFPVLMDVFLKDTPFCYSDKPTIADLSIAPVFTYLKCRKNFWAAVPEKVKEYHARVLEAFPDTKENFDMSDAMCSGYTGDGADCEP